MTAITTEKPLAVPDRLTALDRCDRCGAQAYVRVLLQGERELLFCNHHANVHEAALRSIAVLWQDERHVLYQNERRT